MAAAAYTDIYIYIYIYIFGLNGNFLFRYVLFSKINDVKTGKLSENCTFLK